MKFTEYDSDMGINVMANIEDYHQCLCIRIKAREQSGNQTLYEVIVNDCVDYFVYEIWIMEQSKSIKRFQKEIKIPLSEFRENYYVSPEITHGQIVENFIKDGIISSEK